MTSIHIEDFHKRVDQFLMGLDPTLELRIDAVDLMRTSYQRGNELIAMIQESIDLANDHGCDVTSVDDTWNRTRLFRFVVMNQSRRAAYARDVASTTDLILFG